MERLTGAQPAAAIVYHSPMQLGGIVLAGGAGTRMGVPKALVRLGGVTLVERAVATLQTRCDSVIVVSRPGVTLPELDVPVIPDDPGPASAIVALATGLAHHDAESCLLLACDLPFAAPLLDRLAARPPGPALGVDSDGVPQPLVARYPRKTTLDAANRLIAGGQLALQALVAVLEPAWERARGDELLNVNTPADLARAEAIADQPGSTSTTAL
jgi:molybdopterin-guanine dinucleotide biosynthesis protein A